MKKIYLLFLAFFIVFGIEHVYGQEINPKHKKYIKERFGIDYSLPDSVRLPDLFAVDTIPIKQHSRSRRSLRASYVYDSIPVYGTNGDSFVLYNTLDVCGGARRGEECRCSLLYPKQYYGPICRFDFIIKTPMDILITNHHPDTKILGNIISLRSSDGGLMYGSTKDCFDYYDYERMISYQQGLNSYYIEGLQPGRYTVYVQGLKNSNAGTGYGRIETIVIGTASALHQREQGVPNWRIPLNEGFDFWFPIDVGKHNKEFSYESNRLNMKNHVGFYHIKPFYFYDMRPPEEPSKQQYRYDEYVKNYQPNKKKNVVFTLSIDGEAMNVVINSRSQLYLLSADKHEIASGDKILNAVLKAGKYYIVTETNRPTDRVLIQGAAVGKEMSYVPRWGHRIELDPEKEIQTEPINKSPIQYLYDESGNREARIIYMPTRSAESVSDSIAARPIIEKKEKFTYKIYPNPTRGVLFVEISTDELYEYKPGDAIQIYDRNGVLIKNEPISTDRISVDISDSFKGIYLMQIKVDGQTISWSIIKN